MDQPQNTETLESFAPRLLALLNSHWITQTLYVATELGLPDLLASSPQSSASLAQATGVHAPSLHRLLRALVTLDIVQERADGVFELLPMGARCWGATRPRRCGPGRSSWADTSGRHGATSWTVSRPGQTSPA